MATPLTAVERAELLAAHPAWSPAGEALQRTVEFGDFAEAMAFVNRVALTAQALDHHPDIDIRGTRVTLGLITHFVGGLSAHDRTLAEAIDGFLAGKSPSVQAIP